MRALLVGLVGLIGVTGAVEAKVCRLDGLELVAEPRGSDADQKMVGQKFRVVRQASAFKTLPDPVAGGTMTGGTISVQVEGPAGKFFVGQDYVPHSAPWVSAVSLPASQTDIKVKWSQRDRKREARYFEKDGTFDIYSGPLSGLSLKPTNCIEPYMKKP